MWPMFMEISFHLFFRRSFRSPTPSCQFYNFGKILLFMIFWNQPKSSLLPHFLLGPFLSQCSYILFSVRFRTDSSSVRKKILETFHKIFRTESSSVRKKNCKILAFKNSEPNPVRFGIFSHNLSKFPNYNSCWKDLKNLKC